MKFSPIIISLALASVACGDNGAESTVSIGSNLEAKLAGNTQWPYELVGTLDIVEAGDFDNSDYPDWAVGSIVTETDEWGVLIEIRAGVVSKARINIDSGDKVRAWLDKPRIENGDLFYPIVKIEAY